MRVRIASAAPAPATLRSAKKFLDFDPAGDGGLETEAEPLVEALRGRPAVQIDPGEPLGGRAARQPAQKLAPVSLPAGSLLRHEVVYEEMLAAGKRAGPAHAGERNEVVAFESSEQTVPLDLLPAHLRKERLLTQAV